MPLLLYDAHCSVCCFGALLAAKLTRGYVVPRAIEESVGSVGPTAGLPPDRSWLISGDRATSGVLLLLSLLRLVPIGALRGRGFAGGYSSLRHHGACRLAPRCGAARGLAIRLASFFASTTTRRLRLRA